MKNELEKIPPMIHPYGRFWEQPKADEILIDETTAVMSRKTFEKLKDYSHSDPTGTYEGKMWRSSYANDRNLLCWYDYSQTPGKIAIKTRAVLFID